MWILTRIPRWRILLHLLHLVFAAFGERKLEGGGLARSRWQRGVVWWMPAEINTKWRVIRDTWGRLAIMGTPGEPRSHPSIHMIASGHVADGESKRRRERKEREVNRIRQAALTLFYAFRRRSVSKISHLRLGRKKPMRFSDLISCRGREGDRIFITIIIYHYLNTRNCVFYSYFNHRTSCRSIFTQ